MSILQQSNFQAQQTRPHRTRRSPSRGARSGRTTAAPRLRSASRGTGSAVARAPARPSWAWVPSPWPRPYRISGSLALGPWSFSGLRMQMCVNIHITRTQSHRGVYISIGSHFSGDSGVQNPPNLEGPDIYIYMYIICVYAFRPGMGKRKYMCQVCEYSFPFLLILFCFQGLLCFFGDRLCHCVECRRPSMYRDLHGWVMNK